MSKAKLFVAGVLCSIGLMAVTLEGCGGSSATYASVCNDGCEKITSCTPGATAQDTADCKASCTGETCSNESARVSAGQACLSKDCAAFIPCLAAAPACQSGGVGGHTGATGSGGSTGAAGCSVCDKAPACCVALGQTAATCSALSTAACNGTIAASQPQFIATCQSLLTGGSSANIAACK